MANANRKAIEFMVQGALPPNSTNVLWMDTSDPELPIIKTFNAGAWVSVLSSNDKAVEILSKAVLALTQEVELLSGDIKDKMALDETVAKQGDDDQVSLTSLDFDLGRIQDDVGEVEDAVHDAENKIIGITVIECGDEIPGARLPQYSSEPWQSIRDSGRCDTCTTSLPNDYVVKVGDVFKASDYDTSMGYRLATSVLPPWEFVADGANDEVSGDGITWIEYSPHKLYICTSIEVDEEYPGTLYVYEEYDPSIHGVLNKLDNLNFDTSDLAKQGTNSFATLTATQAALIDGNDTAISVSKEIRSEVGTGSDTAAETGTLFAVVKWMKDKVKSIDALIGYTISEIDGV